MKLKHYIIGILLTYIPFHLFEEAIGNFPELMYQHKWLPVKLTFSHWMANNIFIFYPILLVALFIYLFGKEKKYAMCFGMAILMWGVINFIQHLYYCIIDKTISPGIITGLVFLILAIEGIIAYVKNNNFSFKVLILSIPLGIFLFSISLVLCVIFGEFLTIHFM